MSNGNPFYVDPGRGFGRELAALGQTLAQTQELKRKRREEEAVKQRTTALREEMGRIYREGTPEDMATFAVANPEIQASALQTYQVMQGRETPQGKMYLNTLRAVSADPDNSDRYMTRLWTSLKENNLPTDDAEMAVAMFSRNPERFKRFAQMEMAKLDPASYKALKDIEASELAEEKLSFEQRLKLEDLGRKENKAALERDVKAGKDRFDQAKKLREEYNKRSKSFFDVEDAYGRVEASVDDPDASGDIALIFNFMKMLDPGSVVREGEFATAQNAAGVPESVRNQLNKLYSGERLSDQQRNMFLKRAEKLFKRAESQADKNKKAILSVGNRYNISEQDIFGEQEVVESAEVQSISTQEQYDALPSGATYILDGVEYRKR
jgi:hypothetical protein